jgi:hypothetical protein
MRRVNVDDAVEELIEWVRGADLDAVADLYSKVVVNDSTEAVQVECEGDESSWFVRGKPMKVQLVPIN